MKWLNWLLKPVYGLYRLWYRSRYRKLCVSVVDDIPDQATPGYLCLVGEGHNYWAATMRCPCGCGDTVTLNLIGPHPVWRALIGQSGKVSLHPSVYRQTGCRSHYWVREGVVIWAKIL